MRNATQEAEQQLALEERHEAEKQASRRRIVAIESGLRGAISNAASAQALFAVKIQSEKEKSIAAERYSCLLQEELSSLKEKHALENRSNKREDAVTKDMERLRKN